MLPEGVPSPPVDQRHPSIIARWWTRLPLVQQFQDDATPPLDPPPAKPSLRLQVRDDHSHGASVAPDLGGEGTGVQPNLAKPDPRQRSDGGERLLSVDLGPPGNAHTCVSGGRGAERSADSCLTPFRGGVREPSGAWLRRSPRRLSQPIQIFDSWRRACSPGVTDGMAPVKRGNPSGGGRATSVPVVLARRGHMRTPTVTLRRPPARGNGDLLWICSMLSSASQAENAGSIPVARSIHPKALVGTRSRPNTGAFVAPRARPGVTSGGHSTRGATRLPSCFDSSGSLREVRPVRWLATGWVWPWESGRFHG